MTNANQNTVVLVEQLIAGEEKAFILVMDKYHQKLLMYAYGLSNDYPQASRYSANVFLRLWERRQNINIRESFQGLLYKSVYNEFIDNIRKNKPTTSLDEAYWNAVNIAVDDTNSQLLEDKIRLIKRKWSIYPQKCQAGFLLSKQDGLTNIEIAEYLNISIKTVEYQLPMPYNIIRKGREVKIKKLVFDVPLYG